MNLFSLAQVLGTSPDHMPIARKIMFDAAELGEPLAICELVEAAIRKSSFSNPEFSKNLQRLKTMVNATRSSNRQAMGTLGNYYMSQQEYKEAMRLYNDATDGGTDPGSPPQVLFNMGKIYLLWKDQDAAYSAFKRSAQGGQYEAVYYLAAATEDGSDHQKEAYQFAALSGIPEACHNLGDVELEKIIKRVEKPKTIFDYGMAREWFQVAATNDFVPSMLNMALICKVIGEKPSGMAWLENAENWLEKKPSPELQDLAKRIRSNWSIKTPEISAVGSGYSGKIKPFKELREREGLAEYT